MGTQTYVRVIKKKNRVFCARAVGLTFWYFDNLIAIWHFEVCGISRIPARTGSVQLS